MKAKTILMRYATAGVIAACVLSMTAKAPAQQATKKKAAAAKKEAKKAAAMPAMMAVPAIVQMEPRGMQRGTESRIRLTGTRLDGVTNVAFGNPKITGELVSAGTTNEAVINVRVAADLPRGSYDLSVKGSHGESAKVKLHVDDLPQVYDVAGMGAKRKVEQLPVSFWGAIDTPGRVDHYEFNAKAGQTVVFELAAKSLGSKAAEAVITVVDPGGAVVASNSGFDDSSDALVAYKFPASGTYSVRVSDLQLGASKDNFYRLSVGAFPYVTGVFPIGVPVNQETEVELAGYNLPAGLKGKVKAGMPGEVEVPIDGEKYRTRRAFKVLAVEGVELVEREPNDSPEKATPVRTISSVNGRMEAKGGAADEDFFRFEAKGGQMLVVETMAARRGSPIDTKIEVLHADGKPVQRALLQATRDSYITFRGVDSNNPEIRVKNWEEMELNEYVYFQGEVNRILRMPRGPDSGFRAFTAGAKRISYFDTSATAHALDEPCYTVVAHPVGTKLVPNGLPQFPLYYANDDDGERKLGTDSRVHFTAPADGVYLVRVTDSRGMGGDRYAYRLTLREAKPDFKVTLTGMNPTVEAGAGLGFSVRTERMDEFDDQIVVQIDGLPKGYSATTPLIIQAGHLEAVGSLFANLDAPKLTAEDWKKVKITAKATVAGKEVVQAVNNFGTVQLTASPKVFLSLQPQDKNLAPEAVTSAPEKPLEIVLAPGGKVPAWLRVVRNGDTNLVNLDIDNLPHGVIISDIGLNGVMVRAGETERPIFLEAARWVPEDERLCHVVSQSARAGAVGAGKQTSYPVLLKIRKPQATANATR